MSLPRRGLNNIAQGRGASPRTLGNEPKRKPRTLKGFHNPNAADCGTLSGFKMKLAKVTQGARRCVATLGCDV